MRRLSVELSAILKLAESNVFSLLNYWYNELGYRIGTTHCLHHAELAVTGNFDSELNLLLGFPSNSGLLETLFIW